MEKTLPFALPRFQAALDRETRTQLGLKPDTHQRYKKGRIPKGFVNFLISRPDIAHALCEDIAELTQSNKAA